MGPEGQYQDPVHYRDSMKNVAVIGLVLGLVGLAMVGTALLGGGQRVTQGQDGKKVMKIGPFVVTGESPKREDKVVKTDAEWKLKLTAEQYDILRSHGTEPRFCEGGIGKDKDGVYDCVGCGLPLFKTTSKYDSGSGWPAFFEPYSNDNIWMKMDYSFGMTRVEVNCARCDGHLGHAFEDGPADKTGVRFCINSKVIKFVPNK